MQCCRHEQTCVGVHPRTGAKGGAERLDSGARHAQQVVKRCRIVVEKAEGHGDAWIAAQLGINRHTCRLWRNRFIESGPESLWNVAEGRGRKPRRGLAQKIVEATVRTKPTGQTHWSTRTMAARLVRAWRQDP